MVKKDKLKVMKHGEFRVNTGSHGQGGQIFFSLRGLSELKAKTEQPLFGSAILARRGWTARKQIS